jgi:GNAT superfamily N-acetyltransferase
MAPVQFRLFRPGDETAFRELNAAWIERHFTMEDTDRKALNDPHGYVLAAGGAIVMAEQDGEAVGTCALLAIGQGRFELAKMTVAQRLHGQGIGRKLLAFTIEHARQLGATSLFLETNHTLVNAIHLYEVLGFRHLPEEKRHASPYARSDVQMELIF